MKEADKNKGQSHRKRRVYIWTSNARTYDSFDHYTDYIWGREVPQIGSGIGQGIHNFKKPVDPFHFEILRKKISQFF